MSTTTVWTDARCRIVSKTLFDILKIKVAAAYTSNFFAQVSTQWKIVLWAVAAATALLAFVIYPKEGE